MIGYIFSDYYQLAKAQLKSFVALPIPKHWSSGDKGDIVLIPGLYEKWHFMKSLGEKLSKAGYRIHVIKNLGRNIKSIDFGTKKLSEYLNQHNINNAIIVAHSKGGLIALDYMLKESAKNTRVKKLIAIAVPFSGTNIGKKVKLNAVKELLPENTFFNNIAKNEKINSRVVSIFPTVDNHIWHHQKSFLPGALNIEFQVKGHHQIIFNDRVHKLVVKNIDN